MMASGARAEDDANPISLPSRPRPTSSAMRAPRVLACVQCQHRKIKCNRESPCSHCTKSGVQCVPADLVPKQRRRRFPERSLLDRLRHYENLLKQNNIDFDPLHPGAEFKNETPSTADEEAGALDSTEAAANVEDTPAAACVASALHATSHR